MVVISLILVNVVVFLESDILGVFLLGLKASELKNEELKFLLYYRGDFVKGLIIKVEFVKR